MFPLQDDCLLLAPAIAGTSFLQTPIIIRTHHLTPFFST